MTVLLARLFAWTQYLLPKHALTRLVHAVTRIRVRFVKNALIRGFVRLYGVDVHEAAKGVPDGYATFNDFFIRELADGARTVDANESVVASPVDGTVSQAGTLRNDRLLQAKGIDYSLDDLLAADIDDARAFTDGAFATFYLAPYNYHRVHAPLAGELVAAHYVPGNLFSVNAGTARHIRDLFSRNERVNLHLRTAHGPMAVILVGAMNVGSISTPWSGEIRPRKSGVVEVLDLGDHPRHVGKGDLLGWFNMGSTVIVLLPDGACRWRAGFGAGATTRMGEAIGELPASPQ